MREHGAFGTTGGPRGVHDDRDVLGVGEHRTGDRLTGGQHVVEVLPTVGAADRDEPLHVDVCAHVVDDTGQRGVGDESCCAAVTEDVRELWSGEPEVERDECRARSRAGEQRDQECRVIRSEIGNAIALRDSAVDQSLGQQVNSTLELGERQRLAVEGQCRVIRDDRCTPRNPRTEIHRIGYHHSSCHH